PHDQLVIGVRVNAYDGISRAGVDPKIHQDRVITRVIVDIGDPDRVLRGREDRPVPEVNTPGRVRHEHGGGIAWIGFNDRGKGLRKIAIPLEGRFPIRPVEEQGIEVLGEFHAGHEWRVKRFTARPGYDRGITPAFYRQDNARLPDRYKHVLGPVRVTEEPAPVDRIKRVNICESVDDGAAPRLADPALHPVILAARDVVRLQLIAIERHLDPEKLHLA